MVDTAAEITRGLRVIQREGKRALPEDKRAIEITPQESLQAFTDGFVTMDSDARAVLDNKGLSSVYEKWQQNIDLDPTEKAALEACSDKVKRFLSEYRVTLYGKQLTIDQGKESFDNQITLADGTILTRQEGIPVEGMLNYTLRQIEATKRAMGKGTLSEAEGRDRIKKLKERGYKLYKGSQREFTHAQARDLAEGGIIHSRIMQEKGYIWDDPLRNRNDDTLNYQAARVAVMNRWTFMPPTTPVSTSTSAPSSPPPTSPSSSSTGSGPTPAPAPISEPAPAPIPAPESSSTPSVEVTSPSPTPPEPPARPVPPADRRYDMHIINGQDGASRDAALKASQKVQEMYREGKWYQFWKWPKKLGLRMVEGGYREHLKDRLMKSMHENNTTFMSFEDIGKPANELQEARNKGKIEHEAVIERFKAGGMRGKEVLVVAQGELRTHIIQQIIDPITKGEIADAGQVRQKLAQFVQDHMDDPQVAELFGAKANLFGDVAEIFATDVLATGLKLKGDMEAFGESLDQIDQYVTINLGYASIAGSSDTRDPVDKAIAWAKHRRYDDVAKGFSMGRLIARPLLHPVVVGAATSFAFQGAARAIGTAARAAQLTTLGASSAVAGAAAFYRRYYELSFVDRPMHQLERAYNLQVPESAKRRKSLENYQYKIVNITDLLRRQQTLLQGDLTQPDQQDLLADFIVESNTRMDFSDRHEVDLLGFESQELRSVNRLQLVKAIAEAKVSLKRTLRVQGLAEDQINTQIDAIEQRSKDRLQLEDNFVRDQQQKDREFRNYAVRQSLVAGGVGATIGLVSGAVGQEGMAIIARATGHGATQTALESIRPVNDAMNLVASRTGHSELVSPTPTIDAFQLLAQHRIGSVDLGNHLQANLNPDNTLTIISTTTHQPIPNVPQIFQESDGHIVINGRMDQLPIDVKDAFKGWPQVETISHSAHQQLLDAVAKGGHQTVDLHDIKVDVIGNKVVLFDKVNNVQIPGTIDASGELHLAGTSVDATHAIDQLQKLGFDIKDIKPGGLAAGSPADALKGFIKSGKDLHQNVNGFDMSYSAASHTLDIKNGSFDLHAVADPSTGELTFDSSKNSHVDWTQLDKTLQTMGFKTGHTTVPGSVQTLDQLKNNGQMEHALRDYWHNNDTPIHRDPHTGRLVGADGKEVRFYYHAEANDVVDLDISKMVSNPIGKGHGLNWDKTVDSQYGRLMNDIVTNADGSRTYKNFQILISINDEANKQRLVIPVDMPADGHLRLGPNDPLRQFFDVQNGKVHQTVRFVEVAHVEHDAAGNIAKRTILSTVEGKGVDTVTTAPTDILTAKPMELDSTMFTATPPDAIELTPPTVEPWTPPIIPWTGYPRMPLENLENAIPLGEPIPPMYYGGETLDSLRHWLKVHPERLHPYKNIKGPDGKIIWLDEKNNQVDRDVRRERERIQTYLENIKKNDIGYYSYLENLSHESSVSTMQDECRVSVNIPSLMEGKNIYQLLEKYINQVDENGVALNPNLFEINVIVNRKTGTPEDNTVAEINRFIAEKRSEGKDLHINYVNVEFNPPLNNVGHARKVITDMTLLRSLNRSAQSNALYIESEDADLVHVDPKTVFNLINKLDTNPHLDAVRGIQDRFPEELMKNDLLFLSRRMWDFSENFLRRKKYRIENNPKWNFTWNRIITGGWNTGYTAEAYAMIDGYDSTQTKGEDMTIGEKITMIRGDGNMPNLDVIGKVPTRSDSSPRRFMGEIITGRGAYSDSFEDEEVNKFIKNATFDEMQARISSYARINEANKGTFSGMIEGHFQSIRNLTPNEAEAEEMFNSIMFWLGFKKEDYGITPDGKVAITNWTNVQTALDNYRDRHKASTPPVITP